MSCQEEGRKKKGVNHFFFSIFGWLQTGRKEISLKSFTGCTYVLPGREAQLTADNRERRDTSQLANSDWVGGVGG
jgi:hypothetical protein